MEVCKATKRDGQPCTMPAKTDDGLCWAHDPRNASRRRETAAKAGSKSSNSKKPRAELVEIKARLRKLAGDVLAGNVSRADASVVAQITGVWLRATEVEIKLKEIEEILPRLEAV
jgi:hypothetical protein